MQHSAKTNTKQCKKNAKITHGGCCSHRPLLHNSASKKCKNKKKCKTKLSKTHGGCCGHGPLLHNLLVAALHGAVARHEGRHTPVTVTQQLHLRYRKTGWRQYKLGAVQGAVHGAVQGKVVLLLC